MKRMISLLLLAILVLGTVGCAPAPAAPAAVPEPAPEAAAPADPSWENIVAKGELVVGNCPEYPRFPPEMRPTRLKGLTATSPKPWARRWALK